MPHFQEEVQDTASGLAQGLRAVRDSVTAQAQAVADFDLLDAINWPGLIASLVEIALILLLAFGAYRVLRVFTARLQREVDLGAPEPHGDRSPRPQGADPLAVEIALVQKRIGTRRAVTGRHQLLLTKTVGECC